MISLADITNAINKSNAMQTEEILAKFAAVHTRIDALESKLDSVIMDNTSFAKPKKNIIALEQKVSDLEDFIARKDKADEAIICNCNIPYISGENIMNIFDTICKTIGYNNALQPSPIVRRLMPNLYSKSTASANNLNANVSDLNQQQSNRPRRAAALYGGKSLSAKLSQSQSNQAPKFNFAPTIIVKFSMPADACQQECFYEGVFCIQNPQPHLIVVY